MAKVIRLKGYVLLESMIAMIVVMVCFMIAVMIYENVVNGSRSRLRLLARLRMETAAQSAIAGDQLLDKKIVYDEFTIEQTVSLYHGTGNIYELKMEIRTPDGKQLAEYHQLLRR